MSVEYTNLALPLWVAGHGREQGREHGRADGRTATAGWRTAPAWPERRANRERTDPRAAKGASAESINAPTAS